MDHSFHDMKIATIENKVFRINLRMILFFLLTSYSITTWSQNIVTDTLVWNSTSAVNQQDTSTLNYTCSFATTALTNVDWIQAGGKHVSHFSVNSTDGQWTDVSKDGQLTYDVSNGAVTGVITFSRSGGVLSVHLKLFVNGKLDQDYVFNISDIRPN